MPLTEQQYEEYEAQVQALKVKLRGCSDDLTAIKTQACAAQLDPSQLHLVLAQVSRAEKLESEFVNAWDRITLISIKLDKKDFPSATDRALKTNFMNNYDAVKAVEIHLKREPPCVPPAQRQDTTSNAHEMSTWSRQFLDKLRLPHFDGDVKTWVHFRDIFTSLIHQDLSIPQVAKLHLLISSLGGEARSLINKFEICDASYPLAWAALTKQYDNSRVLATTFLDNILSFRLPSNPSLRDLQKFNTDVTDSISAFRALKLNNPEDKILALIVLKTLDQQNRRRFELQQVETDFPTVDSIIDFVGNQCLALKLSGQSEPSRYTRPNNQPSYHQRTPSRSSPTYQASRSSPTNQKSRPSPRSYHTSHDVLPKRSASTSRTPSPRTRSNRPREEQRKNPSKDSVPASCSFCQQPHALYRCPSFLGLASEDRLNFISKWQGCRNCLDPYHEVQDCRSRYHCRICKEHHHTLLHPISNPCVPGTSGPVCGHSKEQVSVILGTARAVIRDPNGKIHPVRLLLDCGSQKSYIRRSCADRLRLKVYSNFSTVTGLGGSHVATVHGTTKFSLSPLHSNSRLSMTAAIVDKLTAPLPQQPIPRDIINKFRGMSLADPRFYEPQESDILLGAEYFDQVVTGTFYRPDSTAPATLPTIFGMVIMGPYSSESIPHSASFLSQDVPDISSQLRMFWELEEPSQVSRESPDDAFCENHFLTTHSRDATGRYIVRLPFATDPKTLGDNRSIARKRFHSLESKLAANAQLRTAYLKFMEEYEELGHMSLAASPSSYIIPHFGVMQNKLRVVFDASCPSSNMSLNDVLLSGPKLQADICDVLLHFRLFPIAITTDMVKMYRQILVHPEDRKHQHIFWRNSPESKLVEFQLNTVTYGEGPSAFLAIRVVNQLLSDEGQKFPLAVQRLRKAIFVDDICTGADDEDEAKELCHQLISLFAAGGFPLSKWSSNRPSILPPDCETTLNPLTIQSENPATIKVLGLVWNQDQDYFSYTIHQPSTACVTKRSTLSFIARMFDPLGFLAPVILRAKIFLQEIWKRKLDWDDAIPGDIEKNWLDFVADWSALAHIKIPRYLSSRRRTCNLVGFCDASNLGYAALLYLQVQDSPTTAQAFIIKAKSKVAPVKFVSIPRLELCGAHLLAKLVSTIDLQPDLQISGTYLFSDSRVTLGWINTPTHLLKVFEANRVASIHELAPDAQWNHVKTEENPADIASRGLSPSQIAKATLWWQGPPWLRQPIRTRSNQLELEKSDVEPVESSTLHIVNKIQVDSTWMERFSKLHTLLRVTVRILRFTGKLPSGTKGASITAAELHQAAQACARAAQLHFFPAGADSPQLVSLNPFTDQRGILRVGGRLQNAPITFAERHPIVIPKASHLARLIVRDIHERYYHAGPTLTLSLLRSQFWIPSSLRFVKSLLSKCTICFKRRPIPQHAIMAPLPASRFSQGRAFQQTGIDYAGPFTLRDSLRRKPALTKGYLCLFVCLSTKALHLEAVSALTTEAFLASLDRFIARRGKPSAIHTDNATNFIGASRYLKDLSVFLLSHNDSITQHLSVAGVEWNFIPPRSPHFGGIWEAGVKSVKSLLVSSTGSQSFTYEEFSTVLARIESLLNSRPLCPMNDDPDSLDVLTPGHFLIGSAPCFLPEEILEELPANRLSRWQHVQQQVQHIWSRWRREYLNTLQQRTKWRKASQNLSVNDLVILLEKKSPPGHWPLARIVQVHPGSDGTVRVVSIKTSSGSVLKRSIPYLAKLPIFTTHSSS